MKKYMVWIFSIPLCLLCSCAIYPHGGDVAAPDGVPKNVILFIGDGMGVAQVTAGKIVKGELNLERFKTVGLLTTHSRNSFVTDSGASGTAMATGQKTCNEAISVRPDMKPLKTIVEWAEEVEKTTGIVVTSSVTHATPAAFLAHSANKRNHALIAEQIADSGIDVLLGGGWAYFIPQSESGSKRLDDKDLVATLSSRMKVIRSKEEFWQLNDKQPVAGFFAWQHLPKAGGRDISLADMTRKAIRILSQSNKGFFLMVEGSQIDWGCHENDPDYLISEMIDFDDAVGEGLKYARDNGQTLVIVTADHETGGFSLLDGSVEDKEIKTTVFATDNHTAEMIPIFSYGPGCSAFAGIQDNTMVGRTLIEYVRQSDQ